MTEIDFATATVAQLRAFRRNLKMEELSPEQLALVDDLNDLIEERIASESVERAFKSRDTKDKAKKFDERAYRMFPELKDKESPLFKAADKYLGEMDPDGMSPMALLSAAQLAAEDLGISPVSERTGGDDRINKMKGGSGEDKPTPGAGKDFLKRTKSTMGQHFADLLNLSDEKVLEKIEAAAESMEED